MPIFIIIRNYRKYSSVTFWSGYPVMFRGEKRTFIEHQKLQREREVGRLYGEKSQVMYKSILFD